MSGGFWAGAVPPWAYAAFACVCVLFLCVGELDGWRRGEREAREDESWEREQAKARRTHPVYHRPPLEPGQVHMYQRADGSTVPAGTVRGPGQAQFEAAHEAWLAHEEQALAIANERPITEMTTWAEREVWMNAHPYPPPPETGPHAASDTRTDEEWMADEFAKLHAAMDSLLNAHPVTEEL